MGRVRARRFDLSPTIRPNNDPGKLHMHAHTADLSDDADALRRRRASANRTWTILRAALNHAFYDGKVETDIAWRKVKPFKSVDFGERQVSDTRSVPYASTRHDSDSTPTAT